MGQENLHDKIQEMLGDLKGNYNVLEEQIDIDVQLEYFESSKDVKKSIDCDETLSSREHLFSDETSLAQKKSLLVSLASIDKVEAFRTLERYRNNPDAELKEWATLAMQESRMLLESSLLDQNQVFISTGLGGKGKKLRYFVVFLLKDGFTIDSFRKRIVQSEMSFVFKKYEAEIEEVNFSDIFLTVRALIPIELQLYDLFEETVESCNQFGDFMLMNYIITNIKELSFDEITNVLETSRASGSKKSD